ncbi:MAG: LPS-assembly protein LptD [Alphaproteobacteria bacterium]|nr:LPS-assembly protein LptD [Alphaproteobacteria bacterium]QQS56237.1 MAG: LPS-assembly protein LptD [Alphaproteobacteria bacterium]
MALLSFNIKQIYKATLVAIFALAIISPTAAFAVDSPSDSPVALDADSLSHDQAAQTVTASGNVVMVQDGRTLKADRVVYDLKADTVIAIGHVEFVDVNGDRHLAEKVKFNDAMKNGFVEGLKTFLADGSRFTAKKGNHERGITTTMYDATYTPCEPCKKDPDRSPLWQIRASEVEHDKSDKTISYQNARFEWMGVPLAYLPYFEHPDGTEKRKSGFLTPSAGYKSDLGIFVESRYYWAIAPEKDATFGVIAMTRQAPVATGEWRQRWEDAEFKAEGSMTYSDYVDREEDESVRQNKEWRGHIFADALWNINQKWRAGSEINLTSDDQYLRQYDFETEDDDVLENQVYLERFSGRNYAVGRLLGFQDLRVDEAELIDQPDVLPEIQASFMGEPGDIPVLGGRWSLEGSVLGLRREAEDGQDVNRLGLGVGWQRRLVTDFGLLSVINANARSESYFIQDRDDATSDGGETRSFASLDAKTSYPLTRNFERFQAVIEPVASLTLAPNIDQEDKIPNEDSQDVQIDASNLFEPNRFPGLDRIEDQSHFTYGLRTGLYADDGSYGDVFFGQSQRFEDDDNPFVAGSGLNEKESDFVGQISGRYKQDYALDYRFQLANDDLSPQRHEVDASASFNSFSLSTRYLFAKSLGGTDIVETREQIENAASYYINDEWRIRGGARHDLGEDPGLRQANIGVDYFGQCFTWSVTGRRNLTEDSSGDNGTEVLFKIGLKNLGEFEASGLKLSSDNGSEEKEGE